MNTPHGHTSIVDDIDDLESEYALSLETVTTSDLPNSRWALPISNASNPITTRVNITEMDSMDSGYMPTSPLFPFLDDLSPSAKDRAMSIQETIQAERAVLNQRKRELARIKARMEVWTPICGQRVKLNIMGTRYEIPASTICHNPFFRALLSGTFVNPDTDGSYYIQRDPQLTFLVLKYLREASLDLRSYSQRELKLLKEEAEFYMVTELVNLCSRLLGPFVYSTLLEIPASGNGVVFELMVKRPLVIHHIAFFPYTNSVEEIAVYHSEGTLLQHRADRWYKEYQGRLSLSSAVLSKIEFINALYLGIGRHTIAVHCAMNDSAVTYHGKSNVIQPCEHFVFGNQAGLRMDPEVPHMLNARFFVGKLCYSLHEC